MLSAYGSGDSVRVLRGHDFVGERGNLGGFAGDRDVFAQQLLRFPQESRVGGEKRDQRLADLDAVAEFDVDLASGVGVDGLSGLFAARAEALLSRCT